MELKESTTVNIKLGPAVDRTDGYTNESGLTPTVKLSKNGSTLTARNSATAIAYDADGYYTVELNATDTNTRGRLKATMTDTATHLHVWADFDVVSTAFYDDKYAAAITLTAGAASTATLDAGASAVDNYYVGQLLTLTVGTGAGQTRRIIGYVGSTKVATVDSAWATNPASGTAYRILSDASSALSVLERNAVADAYLDRTDGIETGLTPRNAQRLQSAALAGKVSGASAGAGTVTIRNAIADSKNRIIATNDAFGNRTAITPDLT